MSRLEAMTSCPPCHSERVSSGRIVSAGEGQRLVFRPSSLRMSSFTVHGGVPLADESLVCENCGLVWGSVDLHRSRSSCGGIAAIQIYEWFPVQQRAHIATGWLIR